MAANDARFESQQVPSRIYEDLTPTPTAQFTVRNMGTNTWYPPSASPNPTRLGSQNPQDNKNWGTNRIDLPYPISPGIPYTFDIPLDNLSLPPHRFYNFQWQMIQEGVGWFGPLSTNVRIDIEISNK